MTPEDIVASVAARALASGVDPRTVADFLVRVLAADLAKPARDQFYAALHDAERAVTR